MNASIRLSEGNTDEEKINYSFLDFHLQLMKRVIAFDCLFLHHIELLIGTFVFVTFSL